jgi:hypothetical protein
LSELYSSATVLAAIQRATEYGAFTAKHVRKICETESAMALIPQSPVRVSQPVVLQQTVEQRSLVQYVEVIS